jgi:hypothetical protein
VSQNRQVFSAVTDCVISDSGTVLFTDLEFLEGVTMAHTARCSVEDLQNTVKGLTSLTTLVDWDLEDQAIRDFRQQVPPQRLACLRRVALKRFMRIWNTTISIMKAQLLDYMLTMLLILNNSDQQILCAKADNLLRHEIRFKLSSQETLQGSFVLSSPSQDT